MVAILKVEQAFTSLGKAHQVPTFIYGHTLLIYTRFEGHFLSNTRKSILSSSIDIQKGP